MSEADFLFMRFPGKVGSDMTDWEGQNIRELEERLKSKLTKPLITSGTSCFKIDFNGYEITIIKNDTNSILETV